MRQLTTKFGTYKLGQFEKRTGKGVMDLLDIGNLEVNRIAQIIMLGNPQMKEEEEAYQRLDEYLSADDEHSVVSAFFDLIEEMDKDLKIMKSCGLNVKDIKEQFKAEVENNMKNKGFNEPNVVEEHKVIEEEPKVVEEEHKVVEEPKVVEETEA